MVLRKIGVALGLGLLVFLPGCIPGSISGPGCPTCPGLGGTSPPESAAVETVDQGTSSGIRDPRALPIRDGAAWRALWAEHTAGRYPPVAAPAVDFSRDMVIAHFRGEMSTGGYEAAIREIVLTGTELLVRVALADPPPGAIVIQVLTQPFHIVRLPRYEGPVRFATEIATEFAVSGRVTTPDGAGIPGVTIKFWPIAGPEPTGPIFMPVPWLVPEAVVTDGEGNWSQTGLWPGITYRAAPTHADFTFSPCYLDFDAPRTDLNFTGGPPLPC